MSGVRNIPCAPGAGHHHYEVTYLPEGAYKPVTIRIGFRSAQCAHLLSHGLQTRADMAACGCTTAAVKAVDRVAILRKRGFRIDSTREPVTDPETGTRTWQARYRLRGRVKSIRGVGRTPPPRPPAPAPTHTSTPNWEEIAHA